MTRRDDWLLAQLPMGMLEDDFFTRFVRIFQDVATSYMDGVDNLDHIIDPAVAPMPMVPYLGSWIGQRSIDPSLPDELQRRIVREASTNLAWRGTRRGLTQFLEFLCDGTVEVIENGGVFREGESPSVPARVEIRVDNTGWVTTQDFVALVIDELPAHVPAEIFVADEMVWPSVPAVVGAPS